MFYGESMFARVTDGSKIALAYLVAFLRSHGVAMIDCQQETGHLASLGAAPISRAAFLEHVRAAIREPGITDWAPVPPFALAR
jgi:leucyl/phenylalanyl-tRNA--protein transferase